MKKNVVFFLTCALVSFSSCSQKPSVELFKQVFNAHMQKLRPEGYTKRTINFVQVTPGTPNGGYYPFKVTAYVHDYGPGYPSNHYYGQTCLGKMDGWKFDLLKNDFGEWTVQGRFTADNECKNNPSEGAEAIPLSSVPGTSYTKTETPVIEKTQQKTSEANASKLYLGQYACYGTGGRLMAGMGFYLLPGGSYYDLDKQRGGTYTYNAQDATISFHGGFLSGQIGKKVKMTGFQLTNTVNAEPWR
jgi:hypothetical protein